MWSQKFRQEMGWSGFGRMAEERARLAGFGYVWKGLENLVGRVRIWWFDEGKG
jgi:hypothetical protein